MAVNSITFGGVNSADFGIYISGEGVFNAPKRDVEMIAIPGRNGELALDKGRFENIEVTYPAFNFEPNDYETFAKNLSDFRNAICSLRGYQRLTDTFHPDEYRMAAYIGGLEIKPIKYNTASEFSIIFDCKPQRYLTDGETPITLGEWGETETVSGDIVEIENDGIEAVKSLSVSLEPIQDLHGYDKPWSGGNGVNKYDQEWESASISPSNGVKSAYPNRIASKNYIPCTANTQYYVYSGSDYGLLRVCFYDASKVFISALDQIAWNRTITTPNNAQYMLFCNYGKDVTAYNNDIAFNNPSSVTTYSPYSNICPISGRTECVTEVSGVNVWDEEWENGAYDTITGEPYASSAHLRSKNYISCKGGETYYEKIPSGQITILFWDESENYMGFATRLQYNGSHSFAVPTDAKYLKFYINLSTYNHDISINYPSTDTSYHAYNGHTYTTTLGRTVYGGTLDVVSGVLTDKMGMVDLGSLSWTRTTTSSGHWRFQAYLPTLKNAPTATTVANLVCSCYSAVTANQTYSAVTGIASNAGGHYLLVCDENYADAQSFKTAMSGVQLCYELATPQTYQLTGQDIELIEGNNYIWSDSGDVTVEHGQNPNYLVNPTRFESSPLLMVEGYGNISFNGYDIDLEDAELGTVTIANRSTTTTVTIPQGLLNTGDTITVGETEFSWSISALNGRYFGKQEPTATDSNEAFSTTAPSLGLTERCPFTTIADAVTFSYGTASSVTNTATSELTLIGGSVTQLTVSGMQTISYDGDSTITFSHTATVSPSTDASASADGRTHGAVTGYSTISMLGHPTYIDCDYGEAYKYESGTLVSLNKYIDLGSDLPKLGVGENEVTVDDTITELKIEPRWWRI